MTRCSQSLWKVIKARLLHISVSQIITRHRSCKCNHSFSYWKPQSECNEKVWKYKCSCQWEMEIITLLLWPLVTQLLQQSKTFNQKLSRLIHSSCIRIQGKPSENMLQIPERKVDLGFTGWLAKNHFLFDVQDVGWTLNPHSLLWGQVKATFQHCGKYPDFLSLPEVEMIDTTLTSRHVSQRLIGLA